MSDDVNIIVRSTESKFIDDVEYKRVPVHPDMGLSEIDLWISSDAVVYRGDTVLPETYNMGYCNLHHGIIDSNGVGLTNLRNRLTAMAWHGIPDDYRNLVVDHLNSVTSDDTYTNLDWCTQGENVRRAVAKNQMGNVPVYHKSRISGGIHEYESINSAARKFGISPGSVCTGLGDEVIYVHRNAGLFSLSMDALYHKKSYTILEKIKYGRVVVYSESRPDVELSCVSIEAMAKLLPKMGFGGTYLSNSLRLNGSRINDDLLVLFEIHGVEYIIPPPQPGTINIISTQTSRGEIYCLDVLTGDVVTYPTIRGASSETGVHTSTIASRCDRGDVTPCKPKYRFSLTNTFPDKLSLDDICKLGTFVLCDGDGGEVVRASSKSDYRDKVSAGGYVPWYGMWSTFPDHIKRVDKYGYSLSIEIDGVVVPI